jgi:transposase-like protein
LTKSTELYRTASALCSVDRLYGQPPDEPSRARRAGLMMTRIGDALRPRGSNGVLRLKIQTLTEAIERKDAALGPLRELARAVIRGDTDEIERLKPAAEAALSYGDPSKRQYRSFTPEFKLEICRQYRAAQKVHGGVAALLRKYSLDMGAVIRWYALFCDRGPDAFYDRRLRMTKKRRGAVAAEEQELQILRKKVGLTLRPITGVRKPKPLPPQELSPTVGEKMEKDMAQQRQETGKGQQGTVSAELLALLSGGDLP